ncbi:MAG: sigma-54-dependent Fis family transcriptional regulator, partial [Zetaproteobacteria bacterium]
AASASEDLAQCIASGRFSELLYERLSALSVALPPLRERREDVPTLAEYWLARACSALGFAPPPVEPSAMKVLAAYDWPGNLRELRQVMHRLAVLAPGPAITVGDVALALAHAGLSEGRETLADAVRRAARRYLAQLGAADAAELYRQVLAQVEPALLAAVLEHTRGHQLRAARLLGINRNTLRSMLRRYGLNPEDFK